MAKNKANELCVARDAQKRETPSLNNNHQHPTTPSWTRQAHKHHNQISENKKANIKKGTSALFQHSKDSSSARSSPRSKNKVFRVQPKNGASNLVGFEKSEHLEKSRIRLAWEGRGCVGWTLHFGIYHWKSHEPIRSYHSAHEFRLFVDFKFDFRAPFGYPQF